MLAPGLVAGGAFVEYNRLPLGHIKAMSQTRRHPKRHPLAALKQATLPMAESRRRGPQIHHDIKNGASHDNDQFTLRRRILEMQPPQDTA